MGFASGQPAIWPVPPDWASGVRETLSWSTEILQAPATGATQHLAARDTPRRQFSFDVVASGQERRIADALIADQSGARWRLPIWPDVQFLDAVAADAESISCATAGFDFVGDGEALLWRSPTSWAVLSIATVEGGGLALASPVPGDWPRGTRLYPLRWARMTGGNVLRILTDNVGRLPVSFIVDEPCDWPGALPSGTYLGHPVLATEPDWGQEGDVEYGRLQASLDNGSGLPFVHDQAGKSFRLTPHPWELWGRAEHTAFRSLLYGLRGRQTPVWVPSWCSDLVVLSSIGSSATTITVEWSGYTLFGREQPNRRDIRIELNDGTTFLRRITASEESGGNEVLTLSSSLGQAVSPASIRRVSFMTLSTQASDEVLIQHLTDADGHARSVASWQAVVPDV